MSARPALAQLPPEELDLLISRSLDGDLPPEEQEELERHLAADPGARRRREELAALVGAVRELPAPEPPFALATRVSAQVSERAQGLSAAWNRLGIYPPPGVVPAIGVLVLVGLLAGVFAGGGKKSPAPAPPPEHDAPVRVFFQDARTAPLEWNVEVIGEHPAWRLVSAPSGRPSAAVDATYRLTLDDSGHVTSLRPLSERTEVRSDVAQLLRALSFERVGAARGAREIVVRILAR